MSSSTPPLADPLSHYGKQLGLPIFCIGLVFFTFRCVSRILTRVGYRLEDALFYVASGLSIFLWLGNWNSWGNDGSVEETDGDRLHLTTGGQVQVVATEVLDVLVLVLWKAHLLVMYRRFFGDAGPSRRIIYAVGALIVLHAGFGIIGSLAQCVPISALGQHITLDTPPQCLTSPAFAGIFFVPDLLSALAVLCLPLFYLRSLHWTPVGIVALVFDALAGLAIIIFTILGIDNVANRYAADPWDGATEGIPLFVPFFYMLIACYGELHPLFSPKHRRALRQNGGRHVPMLRLGSGSGQDSLFADQNGRSYISSPIQAKDIPTRQPSPARSPYEESHMLSPQQDGGYIHGIKRTSTFGERDPKYIVIDEP